LQLVEEQVTHIQLLPKIFTEFKDLRAEFQPFQKELKNDFREIYRECLKLSERLESAEKRLEEIEDDLKPSH
jgi:hypothetical protein